VDDYPPLSALPQAIGGSGLGMTLWLVSMAIFCIVLNGIVELYSYGNQFEDRGMSMTRLPLTIWAFFVTAIIGVVSFPVLLSAALLLILIEVSVPLFSCLIFILVKCYIIKVDRLFYLSTYFGF
jgi:heme/copper-type cytochrome/quinol oxidase subunit 1